ncbi:MAG: DnaB-like helicase C-terminal domain-containing protein [Thermodesulfobacteriota bacterium]|nr:DnaB-like helicase C-terminal domain-containing protein [Thermodesulfobacteriota bacterium]
MKTDRIPPQSIDAEQALIAALLIGDNGAADVVEGLVPGDFYKTAHQKIFQAAQWCYRRHKKTDTVLIKNRLQETGELEVVGGAVILSDIMENAACAVHVGQYIQIIREKADCRALIDICKKTIQAAYESQDFEAVRDNHEALVLKIGAGGGDAFQNSESLTMGALDRYEKLSKGTGPAPLLTGINDLDALTGGLRGPVFVIIAARPGVGKTALMSTFARNMARAGKKVGLFSIEMSAGELQDRFFSMETGLNSTRFTTGGPQGDEWDSVVAAADRISSWPMIIDDTGGLSIGRLRRRCRAMRRQGVQIIFVDQLSKIRGGEGRSEYERKTDVVNQLAELKKELGIPVVLLAQINRNVEGRASKAPMLGDLKSTGALEEDADIILLLHRDFPHTKNPDHKHSAELELAKHRAGPVHTIDLWWEPKNTEFKNESMG